MEIADRYFVAWAATFYVALGLTSLAGCGGTTVTQDGVPGRGEGGGAPSSGGATPTGGGTASGGDAAGIGGQGWGGLSSGGTGGEGGKCPWGCPSTALLSSFVVVVPKDRVADVANVSATGSCSYANDFVTGDAPGRYWVTPNNAGTCRIAVTFRNGAPTFHNDVEISGPTTSCGCSSFQRDKNEVDVPEAPADAGVRDAGTRD
jgi:hypothetical protein